MKTRRVVGTRVALFIALPGGCLRDAPGNSDLDRAPRASEPRDDLLQPHTALLGARADLSVCDVRSASRHLEDARRCLNRAAERGSRLGWREEMKRLDLARSEAQIDEAQRLLRQLDR